MHSAVQQVSAQHCIKHKQYTFWRTDKRHMLHTSTHRNKRSLLWPFYNVDPPIPVCRANIFEHFQPTSGKCQPSKIFLVLSLLNAAKGRESLLQFNLYLTFYGRAWPYGVPRPPPVRQIADPDTSVVASANDAGAVVSLWGSGHLNFRAPWRHKYYYDVICLYYKEGKGRASLPFAARFASSRRLRVIINLM